MKYKFSLLLITLLISVAFIEKPSLEELKKIAATENYPNDTYLDTVSNKKALVILAHDDDDCAMSGTIFKLKKAGWEVEQWTLGTTELAKKRTTHPAEIICKGNRPILEDGHFRNKNPKDSTTARYMPFPKEDFKTIFETDKVSAVLIKKINEYKPSAIFTLDNEIGAYGNPEHIFISQLVLDLFQTNKINTQKVYQGVYTDHMEKEIIEIRLTELCKKWGFENTYIVAKKVYGVSGMPEPTVEINIQASAEGKMEYLLAYHESAKKNIRKFIPYYNEFDAATYFGIFNREFFKVYEKK